MAARIEIPHDEIADFCRSNHIRRMSLFGSVIRDDFTPESYVDILVEFQPGQTPDSPTSIWSGICPGLLVERWT